MSRDAGMKRRACRPGTPDSAPWMARGGASNTDVRMSRAGVPGRRGMRSKMKVLVR